MKQSLFDSVQYYERGENEGGVEFLNSNLQSTLFDIIQAPRFLSKEDDWYQIRQDTDS